MTMDFFTFYVDVFFPLSLLRLLSDLTVYRSNTEDVLSEARSAYSSRPLVFTPVFWWGACCSVFVLFYYVSLRSQFCLVMLVTITALKRCSIRHYPQLCLGGSCLIYIICVCLRIVVFNTYCVVFSNVYLIYIHKHELLCNEK